MFLIIVQNCRQTSSSWSSHQNKFHWIIPITCISLHAAFVPNHTILRFPNFGHFWRYLEYLLTGMWLNGFSACRSSRLVCRHPWHLWWPLWVSLIHILYVVLNPMKRRYVVIIASSLIKCPELSRPQAPVRSFGEERETRNAVRDGYNASHGARRPQHHEHGIPTK